MICCGAGSPSAPPSVERLILDRLLSGRMTLEFARDLYRQKELFEANADAYRAAHPRAVLVMVADTLLVEDSYLAMIRRLERDYPRRPFFISLPEPGRP